MAGPDAALEARLLLEAALGQSRVWVYQHPAAVLTEPRVQHLAALVDRRLAGEPLPYLLGTREFYGRSFHVDARVLIPRPETELLVEQALAFAAGHQVATIVDVGTGSGVLGISLALDLPASRVVMIDRSAAALAVARRNCREHGVDGRVDLVEGDLLTCVGGTVDLIVANLPYVPSEDLECAQPEVRREPRLALDGGPDGLSLYRRLFAQVPAHLANDGAIFAEIAAGQGAAAAELARHWFPSHDVQVYPDLAGRDRLIAVTPRQRLSPGSGYGNGMEHIGPAGQCAPSHSHTRSPGDA